MVNQSGNPTRFGEFWKKAGSTTMTSTNYWPTFYSGAAYRINPRNLWSEWTLKDFRGKQQHKGVLR
ncbi:hypothetical protein [Pandoraea commovens]|uniref:Uncharacterized protein n=1 Tax=Pandoraea commovens TaxID=2508289 RepID=A0A5E4RHP5_9BURK|nr:hypothetical protein [Pandoraea commovens]VVD62860.1 hypothetical protein PCO31010_00199 [Pandoraea commovens]